MQSLHIGIAHMILIWAGFIGTFDQWKKSSDNSSPSWVPQTFSMILKEQICKSVNPSSSPSPSLVWPLNTFTLTPQPDFQPSKRNFWKKFLPYESWWHTEVNVHSRSVQSRWMKPIDLCWQPDRKCWLLRVNWSNSIWPPTNTRTLSFIRYWS